MNNKKYIETKTFAMKRNGIVEYELKGDEGKWCCINVAQHHASNNHNGQLK